MTTLEQYKNEVQKILDRAFKEIPKSGKQSFDKYRDEIEALRDTYEGVKGVNPCCVIVCGKLWTWTTQIFDNANSYQFANREGFKLLETKIIPY